MLVGSNWHLTGKILALPGKKVRLSDSTFLNKILRFKFYMTSTSSNKKGTLIGLSHNEDILALGILLELENTSITFKSLIKSVRGINRVVLSDINLYE
jgi:hypothetical protein